ncbi:MAG: hypothetical protein AAF609_08530 [Cyanobacteria bacterium P01_C01_bin.120]
MMHPNSGSLILPGHPLFSRTAETAIPPDWRRKAESMGQFSNFVVDADTGLMRPATAEELETYLNEGEYHQRLEQMETEPDAEVEHWDLDNGLVECW